MHVKFFLNYFTMLLSALILFLCVEAIASNEQIQISKLPYTIEEPGHYFLESNLHGPLGANTSALTINVDNVTIDFKGNAIIGSFDNEKSSIGIYGFNRSNITILNGKIIGFTFGIKLESNEEAKNIHLKNMLLDRNGFRGARIEANHVVVEDSKIIETGGTYFFPDAFSAGLEVIGSDCTIENNSIHQTFPVGIGESIGLIVYKGEGCTVSENIMQNDIRLSLASFRDNSNLFVSYGFWFGTNDKGMNVVSNSIQGFTYFGNFDLLNDQAKLSHEFSDNRFSGSSCGYWGADAVIEVLSKKNVIVKDDNSICVQDVNFLRSKADMNDARSLFRFSAAVYTKGTNNLSVREKCDYLDGVAYMNRAADLGLHEAIRIKSRINTQFNSEFTGENLDQICSEIMRKVIPIDNHIK